MRKRLLVIFALAGLADACNLGPTPMPTLTLQSPSAPSAPASEMPVPTVAPSS